MTFKKQTPLNRNGPEVFLYKTGREPSNLKMYSF